MLKRRPLTIVLLLCVCLVCLSSVGAVVCQDNEACEEKLSWPILAVVSLICVVMCFAVFYVESMGHNTGVGLAQ